MITRDVKLKYLFYFLIFALDATYNVKLPFKKIQDARHTCRFYVIAFGAVLLTHPAEDKILPIHFLYLGTVFKNNKLLIGSFLKVHGSVLG